MAWSPSLASTAQTSSTPGREPRADAGRGRLDVTFTCHQTVDPTHEACLLDRIVVFAQSLASTFAHVERIAAAVMSLKRQLVWAVLVVGRSVA